MLSGSRRSIDPAIDWPKAGHRLRPGPQSLKAADYWCRFLEEHRPDQTLDARLSMFRR